MKLLILTTLLLLFATAYSQNCLDWAITPGGPGDDILVSMDNDASGNIYSIGYFSETIDFDVASGTEIIPLKVRVLHSFKKQVRTAH